MSEVGIGWGCLRWQSIVTESYVNCYWQEQWIIHSVNIWTPEIKSRLFGELDTSIIQMVG